MLLTQHIHSVNNLVHYVQLTIKDVLPSLHVVLIEDSPVIMELMVLVSYVH